MNNVISKLETKPSIARPKGGVAAIATFDLVAATLEQLTNRRVGMDGIGVLYGPSGWGKTFSSNTLALETRAYFVQMKAVWTKKTFLQKILDEMKFDYDDHCSIPELFDMVTSQLGASRRVLILDEFNRAIEKPILAQITREIFDSTQTPLLLVGEEQLPNVMARSQFKQLYRRVSAWAEAQDVTVADAAKLAPIYCPGVAFENAALTALVTFSKGSVSSVVKCFNQLQEHCLTHGMDSMDFASLQKIALPSSTHPKRKI
ncbi:MAG: ATP-binding protein [Undibacterium sp.]|uniref:AAA family ATPase n=1 Tax=Undibacterium sp. TaxID=1914977 RepID=UPI002722A652|nr:ATP-binding protein [Undibacterium sp.]MDO8654222.1 ATP-binding protein [Undibacterium sp.]